MAKFSDIYDEYAERVYRYMLVLSQDEHEAEELTQEVFYRAFIHIDRFEGHSSLFTWLCQIGKNHFLNNVKKKKIAKNTEKNLAVPAPSCMENSLIDHESAEAIRRALETLKDPYREVFSLKIFGELKYKEIADILGKTESWAKVTFYRAKEQIVRMMEDSQWK